MCVSISYTHCHSKGASRSLSLLIYRFTPLHIHTLHANISSPNLLTIGMQSYTVWLLGMKYTHMGDSHIPTHPQTLQQGSMGNTCARACLRTTVPEIILLVVHHVCWGNLPVRVSLHLQTRQHWTQRHSSFSHLDTSGMYLLPSFNYSEAEQLRPGIRAVDSQRGARQQAGNDESGVVTLLIITQHSVIASTVLWTDISVRDMYREREEGGIAYKAGHLSAWWCMGNVLLNL